MTSVQTVNTTPDTPSVDPELQHVDMKGSIAAVITALTGKIKTADSLNAEQISEDMLFAATVHSKLAGEAPELAERYLKQLPKTFNNNMESRKAQSLYQATQEILRRYVQRGSLPRAAKVSIMKESFSEAQLDERSRRLGRKVVSFTSGEGNINALIERTTENATATGTEFPKFRSTVRKRGTVSQKRIDAQRSQYDLIDALSGKNPTESSPTEDEALEEIPEQTARYVSPAEDAKRGGVLMLDSFHSRETKEVYYEDEHGTINFEKVKTDSKGHAHWKIADGALLNPGGKLFLMFHDKSILQLREFNPDLSLELSIDDPLK